MATRVLMAIFAMMLLTACNQAVPSSASEGTVSANGDVSNSGKADSPNNMGSEDSSDGSVSDGVDGESDGTTDPTDGTVAADGTDLPPLDPCVNVQFLPEYYTLSGSRVTFDLEPFGSTCQITVRGGGGSFDERTILDIDFPLFDTRDEVVDFEIVCLEHRADGVPKTVRMRLYYADTPEMYSELMIYEPTPSG